MAKYTYKDFRRPKTKRPFRLLDLPVEIQDLIIEQIALDTSVSYPFPNSGPQIALLQTSKAMRQQALPAMCTFATLEIRVRNWNFGPVLALKGELANLRADLRISTRKPNPPFKIVLGHKCNPYSMHSNSLDEWLLRFSEYSELRWEYVVDKSEKVEWKSRSNFMWNAAVPDLRAKRKVKSKGAKLELDRMITAFEEEADWYGEHAQVGLTSCTSLMGSRVHKFGGTVR